jgi:hypothetical protein
VRSKRLHAELLGNDHTGPVYEVRQEAEGVAVGRAAFDSRSAERLAANGEPIILVRPETSTADVAGFALAGAVVKVRRPDALTVDAGKNESRQAMPVAPRPLTAGSPRTRRDSCARRPRGRPATLRFAAPAPTSELSYQGLPNNQIKFESARGAGSGFPLIGAGARSLCWVMVATLRCDKFNTK